MMSVLRRCYCGAGGDKPEKGTAVRKKKYKGESQVGSRSMSKEELGGLSMMSVLG